MSQAVHIKRYRAVIQIAVCMLVGGLVGWGLHELTYKPPETFVYSSISFPEGASAAQVKQIRLAAKESADRVVGVQHTPAYRFVQAIASIGFFSILCGMIGVYSFLMRIPKPS